MAFRGRLDIVPVLMALAMILHLFILKRKRWRKLDTMWYSENLCRFEEGCRKSLKLRLFSFLGFRW